MQHELYSFSMSFVSVIQLADVIIAILSNSPINACLEQHSYSSLR